MVDAEVLRRRLQKLEELLLGLSSLRDVPRSNFLTDRREQAVAERWLHLAAECVLDIAHHIISARGWREPRSFRDTIEVLVEQGVLGLALGQELALMAGLRNVLVHLYLDVDHSIVRDVIETRLDVFRDFAAAVQKLMLDEEPPA